MKTTGKLLAGTLFAALLVSSVYAAGFAKTKTYTPGQFTDVNLNEWYAAEIANTFELGLMQGESETLFDPEGKITVAEAITMASRAAAAYVGEEIPAAEGEWYQAYLNYASAKGFLFDGQFTAADYDRPAKRREVAVLFSNALPDECFTPVNDVKEVPDVRNGVSYSGNVLKLYQAGIVMGSDSYGNFRPEDDITRAEAAAIINRVALPENRLHKTLDKISDDEAYILTLINYASSANKTGIWTGWLLDNRGGTPKTTTTAGGGVSDISKTEGTALIREFNKTTTGTVVIDTEFTLVSEIDGIYAEFRAEDGSSVYRLEVKDGKWNLVGADGAFTPIADATEKKYYIRVELDIDNARARTYIDGVDCGVSPTMKTSDVNVMSFAYGTTEESTGSYIMETQRMQVNYAVFEMFNNLVDGKPIGWVMNNAEVKSGIMNLAKDGNAFRYFNPVTGKVIAETQVFLNAASRVNYLIRSGERVVVNVSTDGKNLVVNGQNVYEYYDGLWYRLRFELDTEGMSVLVKLNGRQIAEVPFDNASTSVDNIVFANYGEETAQFDEIKLFRTYNDYRADYVPEPKKPAGEEKYTIGMNICSLWQEGTHWGWSCITPYEDFLLGYYDEGIVESADWEIKMMVDHGIDFQAFCWYADKSNGYLKDQSLSAALHDGYMNARYSDQMKYCLIWEAANAQKPKTLDDFKKYYVPYMIENYFKDPRYMRLDNQALLCIFSPGSLGGTSSLGSGEVVKAAFAYLEDELKKIGYDGLIILGCNSDKGTVTGYGLDGSYAYNWGNAGYQFDVNKTNILNSAKGNDDKFYTVPTISVGFNNIGWANTRHPMMTVEDYKKSHEWVRDSYLPQYSEKGTWKENLVMLSTWNEYGEGTYIMPAKNNGGYGYIDALREVYSDEKENASVDITPTAEQLRRIDRMYPQYRHVLRDLGYSELEQKEAQYEVYKAYDFSKDEVTVGGDAHYTDWKVDENGVSGVSGVKDNYFFPKVAEPFDIGDVTALRVTCAVPAGQTMEVFFITEESGNWAQDKSVHFTSTTDDMHTYTVAVNRKVWVGNLLQFRCDPCGTDGKKVAVKSVEFLTEKTAKKNIMTINGMKFELNTPNESKNGETLVAFDPAKAMDYRLDAFVLWNRDAGELDIKANHHEVVFTVGKNTYTADGASKSLGYELYTVDGLPMVPMKKLCEALGYTYAEKDGDIEITTGSAEYFKGIAAIPDGSYEFDHNGYLEGWSSTLMTLAVGKEGFLTAISTTSTDPIMTTVPTTPLESGKFNVLKVRVRWAMDTSKSNGVCMYFLTDRDGSWAENKALRGSLPTQTSNDEFVEIVIPTSACDGWSGKVTNLRFDPFNATGRMDIDYIRFEYDPEYPDTYDVVHAEELKHFSIKNGDAEGQGGFESLNGNMTIVDDPDGKYGKSYLNMPKTDAKVWLYAEHAGNYAPGETYHVSMDIRLASFGLDTDLADDFAATILCNAKYSDTDGKTDHVVARKTIKAGDGWVHWEFDFSLGNATKSRTADKLSFYSDPIEEKGIGYYFDNVVISDSNGSAVVTSDNSGKKEETKKEETKKEDNFVATTGVSNAKAEVINGDAEDTTTVDVCFSDTATITIESEGDNHYWLATPKGGKVWAYLRQKISYERGKTYKCSFDAKLVELDSASIMCNFVYKDPEGKGAKAAATDKNSHLANSFGINNNTWTHCECTMEISADSSDASGDQIAFYIDPKNDLGVAFMIDNIVVEEAE